MQSVGAALIVAGRGLQGGGQVGTGSDVGLGDGVGDLVDDGFDCSVDVRAAPARAHNRSPSGSWRLGGSQPPQRQATARAVHGAERRVPVA